MNHHGFPRSNFEGKIFTNEAQVVKFVKISLKNLVYSI